MRKIKAILIWSVAIGMTISLTACLKTSEPTKNPAQTYVSIMQLATNAATPAVDIFFGTTKVSNTAFAPGTISPAYSAVEKGDFSISFKKTGSDSLVASLPSDQYDSLGFYTVLLFNQTATGPVVAARIEDDYSDLTLDKPFIRFFHASPTISDLGSVDVYMDEVKVTALSGRMLGDNQYGGYFNEFQPTTAGNHTFKIKLTSKDTTVATLTDAPLIAGNAYTLYLKGNTATGTGANVISLGLLRAAN